MTGRETFSGPDVTRSSDPFAAGVNPDVYLTGGNHPASKLYKAKLALNKVLPQVDNVNFGFATYLQTRDPPGEGPVLPGVEWKV